MPDVSQVTAELGLLIQQNNDISHWLGRESTLRPFITLIDRVEGTYPAYSSVMSHVVQEYKSVWNPMGDMKFFVKPLETNKHKINLSFNPDSMMKTWLSRMRAEGRQAHEQPISLYILNKLEEQFTTDMAILEHTGVYVPDTGQFGFSMDGIHTICQNTLATGNPYRIPLPAPTEENIVHWVEAFWRSVPSKLRKKMEGVHMSEEMSEMYAYRYRDLFGEKGDYNEGSIKMSWLHKKKIFAHDGLDGTTTVFAAPNGTLVGLIDTTDRFRLTKVETVKYEAHIMGEGSYAMDFWADEVVAIADIGGTERGLATNHALYYPEVTNTDPIPLPS
jgi:hypothetical protein